MWFRSQKTGRPCKGDGLQVANLPYQYGFYLAVSIDCGPFSWASLQYPPPYLGSILAPLISEKSPNVADEQPHLWFAIRLEQDIKSCFNRMTSEGSLRVKVAIPQGHNTT